MSLTRRALLLGSAAAGWAALHPFSARAAAVRRIFVS